MIRLGRLLLFSVGIYYQYEAIPNKPNSFGLKYQKMIKRKNEGRRVFEIENPSLKIVESLPSY